MQILQGAGRCLAQMRFEFGESLFNGVEVWTVRWQVTDPDSARREQPADVLNFVRGEVVEDDGVPHMQLRAKHPLQINRENLGIHGAFDQEGGFHAFMAQGRNKSGALPVAVRDGTDTTLAHRAAPVAAGHLGVQAGFINEHQMANIPVGLLPLPKPPGGFNIGPILLGGARRFFYSSNPVVPDGATKR